MLKKTITFKDFNGEERTEDFYFNLTKAEVLEMELAFDGGLSQFLMKIVATKESSKLIEEFKKFIRLSYGEKSNDGRRFIKTNEVFDAFAQTEAYSELFLELAFDANAAADFVNGVVPQHDKTAISELAAK